MEYFVYILASKKHGTLYIGVTNNIASRVHQHKTGTGSSFAQKYEISKLVYVEIYKDIRDAIWREKCLKKWNRAWKIKLIEEVNPDWEDLYNKIL